MSSSHGGAAWLVSGGVSQSDDQPSLWAPFVPQLRPNQSSRVLRLSYLLCSVFGADFLIVASQATDRLTWPQQLSCGPGIPKTLRSCCIFLCRMVIPPPDEVRVRLPGCGRSTYYLCRRTARSSFALPLIDFATAIWRRDVVCVNRSRAL